MPFIPKYRVADVNTKAARKERNQCYISLEVLGCQYIVIFSNIKYKLCV